MKIVNRVDDIFCTLLIGKSAGQSKYEMILMILLSIIIFFLNSNRSRSKIGKKCLGQRQQTSAWHQIGLETEWLCW